MPKVKGLTQKQAKFVQGIAQGKTASIAAQDAYDVSNYATARVIASENLTKPNIQEAVTAALGDHDLTAFKATMIVKEAMEYEGMTPRDTLEMRLKGTDRFMKLLQMTEDKSDSGKGNVFILNNSGAKTYFKQGKEVTDGDQP